MYPRQGRSCTLLPDELRILGLTMGDSIRDSIVTSYITHHKLAGERLKQMSDDKNVL